MIDQCSDFIWSTSKVLFKHLLQDMRFLRRSHIREACEATKPLMFGAGIQGFFSPVGPATNICLKGPRDAKRCQEMPRAMIEQLPTEMHRPPIRPSKYRLQWLCEHWMFNDVYQSRAAEYDFSQRIQSTIHHKRLFLGVSASGFPLVHFKNRRRRLNKNGMTTQYHT